MDPRLFQPFPAEIRHQMEERYVDYCYDRFGAPDFAARTFEKREAFLAAYARRPIHDGAAPRSPKQSSTATTTAMRRSTTRLNSWHG